MKCRDETSGLTVPEAAMRLGVCARTGWQLVYSGELSAYRVGRAVRVTPSAVAEYIERNRTKASAKTIANNILGKPKRL